MYYTLIIEDRNGIIANELSFEQGSYTVGRVEGNDVILSSGTVSRRHARVFTDSGRCFVEDLNSSNGVYVDGQRIVGTSELMSGSQIRIGDYLLVLKAKAQPGQASLGQSFGGFTGARAQPARVHEAMMYPRLVRVGDALEGETFALTERENTVGRTDDNVVLLSDASVSRHHAKVIVEAGRYVAADLGSSNGTKVNNHDVYQPTLVTPGDVLRFGNVRFALAAPGQTVDLREYSRYLSGTSRGLIIAVTVMALLLVLVASGIGIYVVLDQREATPTGPPPASPVDATDRARGLMTEGDALAAAEQWNEAIVKYELALNFDPELAEAAAALRRTQAEFNASRIVQEADMSIHSADRIEREGNPREAADLYRRARARLLNVPQESTYYRSAHDRVTMLIDPALMDIHRMLGQQAFDGGLPGDAARHYREALDIWEALPEDRRSNVVDDLRNRLWRALIGAGDAAFEADNFSEAVTFYEQAQLMGELRREVARRLEEARERL